MLKPNRESHSLLSRKQVAKILGLSTKTVKIYQRSGTLPAIVLNSRVTRYYPKDVDKLVVDGRVGG